MTETTTPKKPRTVSPELAASRLAKRLAKVPVTTLRHVAAMTSHTAADIVAEEAAIERDAEAEAARHRDKVQALYARRVAAALARAVFALPEWQRSVVRATVVASVKSAAKAPGAKP